MNRCGKNDALTGPEAWTHRRQVKENQCAACRNRVDTGERAFGVAILECSEGLRLPRRGMCKGFDLDMGEG